MISSMSLSCVHVEVDVNDAHVPLHALGDASGAGVADRVVAAQDHWECFLREDVRNALGDLVVALVMLAGQKMSPTSHMEIDSDRSIPCS